MKGTFREQLEQAVKSENQVFAERVRSDEAKEVFRSVFREGQARIPSAVKVSQATKGDDFVTWIGRVK
jgi:hypothetical protein